jgi:hypothetical protein
MLISLIAYSYLLTFIIQGDLNIPVLQCWWLEFNFGVLIFILKRVRQGLLGQHMFHHRRAMHRQKMLKSIITIMGVTDPLYV